MTKVKSRTLKAAGRLIDDGVSLQTQSCSRGNLLMRIVVDIDQCDAGYGASRGIWIYILTSINEICVN